jgi:succinoglycan biosynthesis transport protein ExoP
VARAHSDSPILVPEALNSPLAEAYRALRANIMLGDPDRPVRTLAVLSASRSEGKTTTTVNLGIILAQAGSRVVIVDADLRRPSLQQAVAPILPAHAGEPSAGLSAVVLGSAMVEDVLEPTIFETMTYLAAGSAPTSPGELLVTPGMERVITELAGLADFVVFDTPYLLGYTDGLIVARMVDAVIYVVRAGVQDKAAQRHLLKRLEQAKVRVLGVVFNDVAAEDVDGTLDYYPRAAASHSGADDVSDSRRAAWRQGGRWKESVAPDT